MSGVRYCFLKSINVNNSAIGDTIQNFIDYEKLESKHTIIKKNWKIIMKSHDENISDIDIKKLIIEPL